MTPDEGDKLIDKKVFKRSFRFKIVPKSIPERIKFGSRFPL
jgi:hypothetical protein